MSARRLAFGSWLLAATLALPAAAGGFRVESVRTHLDGETYVMDARIAFGFSELALEALDNGVPLTIEVHVQVRPKDAWIWDDNLLDRRLRYAIRYKPLSERFDLQPDTAYKVYLKAELDIEELPLPLRPMAYLRPAWKLSTGWTKWPIEP
jgi:hypothetical protein